MRWFKIPPSARKYILYHTIVSPFLITWYMLPLFMFMTGYDILNVGAFFTVINVIAVPLTYLIGKVFRKIALRHGLVIIDLLSGLSNLSYSFAYGIFAPIALFAGRIFEEISSLFYPLYQAAERVLYPENKMEEIFAWHMRLPMASQMVGFLVFGYVFGYVYTSPHDYRLAFFLFGVVSAFTILYLVKFLPKLDAEERIKTKAFKFKVDREFQLILLLEAILTLAWSMAPEIVLLNYVVNVLGKTLFEVMLVEVFMSSASFLATFVSERIKREKRFTVMAVSMLLITSWAVLMMVSPPFPIVLLAYFIGSFGDTLMFPFYRTWIFSKIPKDKASEILAAVSSYRKMFGLAVPLIAGALASVTPTMPYTASLFLYMTSILLFLHAKRAF